MKHLAKAQSLHDARTKTHKSPASEPRLIQAQGGHTLPTVNGYILKAGEWVPAPGHTKGEDVRAALKTRFGVYWDLGMESLIRAIVVGLVASAALLIVGLLMQAGGDVMSGYCEVGADGQCVGPTYEKDGNGDFQQREYADPAALFIGMFVVIGGLTLAISMYRALGESREQRTIGNRLLSGVCYRCGTEVSNGVCLYRTCTQPPLGVSDVALKAEPVPQGRHRSQSS